MEGIKLTVGRVTGEVRVGKSAGAAGRGRKGLLEGWAIHVNGTVSPVTLVEDGHCQTRLLWHVTFCR